MGETAPQAQAAGGDTMSAEDFLAPPSIPHYEQGPVTQRTVEHNGILWSVVYFAEHDGLGWLVRRCECRPEEAPNHLFQEGDVVHVRLKVVEDGGSHVKFRADDPGLRITIWLPRGRIVKVERPAA